MNPAGRNLRVAAIIAVFLVYFGHQREGVEAAPIVTDWCFNVCDAEANCTEPCLVVQGELPALEITCGEYDGGPSNDWCNGDGCEEQCSWWSSPSDVCWWQNEPSTCEDYGDFGECGDDVCVGWQGETCGNCEEDCGVCPEPPECPNSLCEIGETWRSCPQDCPEPTGPEDCGDGVCSENEDGTSCPDDCTFSGEWCGGFEECPDGWECVNEVCLWETDPLYKCCEDSEDGSVDCLNDWTVCNVGEVCGDMPEGDDSDPAVCIPVWWTTGT